MADPHLSGVALLLTHRYEEAIERLRSASTTGNADAWSDLAAALLVHSLQTGTHLPALDALGAADEALRLNPAHAPATFNRALALEALGLLDPARHAWRRYIDIDGGSGWGADASASLARLDEKIGASSDWRQARIALEAAVRRSDSAQILRIVRLHPRDARASGEALYPSNWAEAVQNGDEESARAQLAYARAIGEALRTSSGERLLADSIEVIDRSGGAPSRRALLTKAYHLYRTGRMDHARNAVTAASRLREAADIFALADSPMQWVAAYYYGSALYGQQRLHDCLFVLDALAALQLTERGYFALAAQIGWERSLATLGSGTFSAALEILADSEKAFDRLGEQTNAAMIRSFAAIVFDMAGDAELAWRTRRDAFLALADDAARTTQVIGSATTALISRREWRRARPLLDIVLEIHKRLDDPARCALALAQRSAVLAALGEARGAESDLAALRANLATISDPAVRESLTVDALYAEAVLLRHAPDKAIERLTLALEHLHRSDRALFGSRIYLERARAWTRRHDIAAARADILAGLALTKRNRETIVDAQLRAMLMGSVEELFEDGIALALERGDYAEAFDLAEQSRARSLLESFNASTKEGLTSPLSLVEIRKSLASNAAVVEYALVHNRLVAFVVTAHKGIRVVQTSIAAERLQQIVKSAAVSLRQRQDVLALERAWNVLIEPIVPSLIDVHHVAIVPGRHFGAVPFAVLRDKRRRRFLIDDMNISIAPSASLAIASSRRAARMDGTTVLSIGASDFDARRFPNIEMLPWASPEARSVRGIYENGRLLEASQATPSAVVSALQHAEIVHYAGHTIVRPYDVLSSALLLASDGSRSTLTAGDIARLRMPRTRLVVLSSCRSAMAGTVGDGVENLATAFMVAGVPSIVGASWDVDDRASADLAARFHRAYRKHGDAARAFRDAVQLLPAVSNVVPEWAVITPFGGSPALVRKGEKR